MTIRSFKIMNFDDDNSLVTHLTEKVYLELMHEIAEQVCGRLIGIRMKQSSTRICQEYTNLWLSTFESVGYGSMTFKSSPHCSRVKNNISTNG